MSAEKTQSKTFVCILIWIIVIIWLLWWILAILFNIKEELNYARNDAWNAYDSSTSTYHELKVIWNDVESILNKVSEQ